MFTPPPRVLEEYALGNHDQHHNLAEFDRYFFSNLVSALLNYLPYLARFGKGQNVTFSGKLPRNGSRKWSAASTQVLFLLAYRSFLTYRAFPPCISSPILGFWFKFVAFLPRASSSCHPRPESAFITNSFLHFPSEDSNPFCD